MKTQKLWGKSNEKGARGLFENRFCYWVGGRGEGGNTIALNLLYKKI